MHHYFNTTRQQLKNIGLPSGDDYLLYPSNKIFDDNAHYRIEAPTINSFKAAKKLLQIADERNIIINRITETYGGFRHTIKELNDYISLCRDYGCELVISQGPRAKYDTSATAQSQEGQRIAYRLRGQEQLIRAIEDVKRCLDLGIRNFLLYDEGLLFTLNELRKINEIPKTTKFKISAHCGYANPISIKILETIGADSINPVRDLSLPMLATIRQHINIPLDCHTDNPNSSGGFIRTYEIPEMIKVLSP